MPQGGWLCMPQGGWLCMPQGGWLCMLGLELCGLTDGSTRMGVSCLLWGRPRAYLSLPQRPCALVPCAVAMRRGLRPGGPAQEVPRCPGGAQEVPRGCPGGDCAVACGPWSVVSGLWALNSSTSWRRSGQQVHQVGVRHVGDGGVGALAGSQRLRHVFHPDGTPVREGEGGRVARHRAREAQRVAHCQHAHLAVQRQGRAVPKRAGP